MTRSAKTLFDCGALASCLLSGSILLNETLAFIFTSKEQYGSPPLEVPARHCKDPLPPWSAHAQLIWQCLDIMISLAVMDMPSTLSSSTFACLIH